MYLETLYKQQNILRIFIKVQFISKSIVSVNFKI